MTYPPTPFPVPGVTLPNWGQQLLDSIAGEYDRGTMARVANGTGTATFVPGPAGVGAGAVTPIAGMVLAIPPTEHDVDIRWQANLGLGTGTTANSFGPIYTLLYELTTGVPVVLDSDVTLKDLGLNYVAVNLAKHKGDCNVGPADHARVFGLYAQVVKEGGTTLNASVHNSAGAPTRMKAVAA